MISSIVSLRCMLILICYHVYLILMRRQVIYNVSCVNDIHVSAINIARETRKDAIIAQVCEYVMAGCPNYVSDEWKLYFMKRNELSMEQGCSLWGYRVVIPPKFRHVLLKELHNEHSGISQTKSFARSYNVVV